MLARFAVATASIPPPNPTITYGVLTSGGTATTATITNFSTEFSYIVTSNVGTVSRSASTVTITSLPINTSVNLLVIATSARGLSTPSSAVTERRPYTFRTETRTGTRFVDTTSCYPASPGPSCPFGGVLNFAGTECCIASGYTETFTFTVEVRNDTPAGFLDSGFDWYRVANVSIERIPYTFTTRTETYTFPCTSTCCVDLPYEETYTEPCCENQFDCSFFRDVIGDGCCNYNIIPNSCIQDCGGSNSCPSGWFCGACNCQTVVYEQRTCCGTTSCTRTRTVCCRQFCSPCTITCTGTRQVTERNPTPPGYLDSGVDWYRFL